MNDNQFRFLCEELAMIRSGLKATVAEIERLKGEIKRMSSTVGAGLAALTLVDAALAKAVSDNSTAQQAVLTELQQLVTQASQNEDPQVQSLAADMQAKVDALTANTAALQAAVPPPAPPADNPPAQSAQEKAAHAQSADIAGAATEEPFKPDTGVSEPKEAGKVHYH